MTTTRERLDRRNRTARVLFIALGVVVVLAVLAAAGALWLLPPVLAETPRERFTTPTQITLRLPITADAPAAPGTAPTADAASSADELPAADAPATPDGTTAADASTAPGGPAAADAVTAPIAPAAASAPAGTHTPEAPELATAKATIDAGWLALGVGPFLDPATAAFVSPDDAYRADLALLPLDGSTAAAALAGYLAGHNLADAASGATWSEETLTSGLTVRYADVTRGADTTTIALIESSPAVLVLRATVDSTDAARYRTVTADLAASVDLSTDPAEPTP